MKKIIAMALGLLMLLALAAGCSSNGGETTPDASPSQSVAASPSSNPDQSSAPEEHAEYSYPIEGSPTLSVWVAINSNALAVIDNFEETYGVAALAEATGVNVEWQIASTDMATEMLSIQLSSGLYADVMLAVQSVYTGGLTGLLNEGIALDLTDIIPQYMPNYFETITTQYNVKDTLTDDGRMLGVYSPNMEGFLTTNGPMVRQDWLDDLGLEAPVTYDDYYDMLTAFKVEKDSTAPMYLAAEGVPTDNYLAAGYEVAALVSDDTRNNAHYPFYVVDGEIRYGPLESGWIEFMGMMQKWYDEGLIYKDFLTQTDRDLGAKMFAGGESGLMHSGSMMFERSRIYQDSDAYNPQPIRDAVRYEGQELHLMRVTQLIETNGTVITTNCEDVELACRWLDFGFTEEGFYLANWGIEGESYEIVDGVSALTDMVVNNPGNFNLMSYLLNWRTETPCIVDWTVMGTDPIQFKASEVWNEINDADWVIPSCKTMTEEEASEYAALYGDIQTLVVEYYRGLIVGERSVDEYDKFVSDLKTMGIDRCIELHQASLERYYNR